MEKGTREVQCRHCLPERTIIRIKITAEMYGKRVRITCKKCTMTFLTEPIPVPALEPEQARDKFSFDDLFGDWLKPKK